MSLKIFTDGGFEALVAETNSLKFKFHVKAILIVVTKKQHQLL